MSFENEFDEKKKESIKPDYLVYKANPLLMARDELALMQARFFTAYLCKVNPSDPETYKARFSLAAFCKMLDVDTSNIKKLKADCHSIRKTGFDFIEYRRRHGEKIDPILMDEVSLFERFAIVGNSEEGYYVEVTPTRPMEHLLENQAIYGYVEYEAQNALVLSSKRYMRMYEFLKRHEGKSVNVDIPTLRAYLGLSKNEYPEMRDFKSKVLKKGVQEVNEKTDIFATYEPGKRGSCGKILSFKFTVMKKHKIADVLSSSAKEEAEPIYLNEKDIEDFNDVSEDEIVATETHEINGTTIEQIGLNLSEEQEDLEYAERTRRNELCDGFQYEIFDEFTYDQLVELLSLAQSHVRIEDIIKSHDGEHFDPGELSDLREAELSSYIRMKILLCNASRNPVPHRYQFIKKAVLEDWT